MSKRRADGGRIARAAASAGLLAVIIIAKAGSLILGYPFDWSLVVLAVLALLGAGGYLLTQRRGRSAPVRPEPAADLTVPAPAIPANSQEPPTQPVHYIPPAPPTAYSQ
ncbi:hypothetical protein [Nocardia acidivorans]|uniref:hypothetical protein n=1 Tax=Nocardia acidivorans TaxID=404580 RepID=UPI00082CF0A4|nr:hypothetical protein [Nocardia acidivorans]